MRYRNQSTPNLPQVLDEYVAGVHNVYSTEMPALTSRSTWDEEIKDFHRRSRNGEIFNNPFDSVQQGLVITDNWSASEGDNAQPNYYHATHRYRLWADTNKSSFIWPTALSGDIANAHLSAQQKALASVNQTDVDIAAFAGEWSKTKQLHRDVFNALYDLLLKGPKGAVRRRSSFEKIPLYDRRGHPVLNRKGEPQYRYAHTPGGTHLSDAGSQQTRNLANTYLVGRYGIVPLLKDLENAVKLLHRTYRPRYTARGQEILQGNATAVRQLPTMYGYFDCEVSEVRTYTVRYGMLYETDILSRLLAGLGLTRPLKSAWELMRLSFVVDWLVGVGTYLDAIQPAGFTKTLSAWVSTHDFTVRTAAIGSYHKTQTTPTSNGWRYAVSWTGGFTQTSSVKNRAGWIPTLPTRPAFGQGFNAIRSVDFAALMLQRIGSLGK